MPTVEEIRKSLEVVIDPELHRSIVELDMVRRIEPGADGDVAVTVTLTTAGCRSAATSRAPFATP